MPSTTTTEEKKKDGIDLEIHAMKKFVKALEELDDDASRARVLAFVTAKTLGSELAAPLHGHAIGLMTGGR